MFSMKVSFFIDQNSAIQFAIFIDNKDIFEYLLNYLMKNKKLSKEALKELLLLTKSNEIKSLIVNFDVNNECV